MRSTILLILACLWLSKNALAQAPVPAFAADPVAGCSPLVVNFTDQSTGSPTSWSWDFGNGATSSLKNPSTTYFLPGKYTVSLTVTNASGTNTVSRTAYITVYNKPAVVFSANDSVGCFPFNVQFTDASLPGEGNINNRWVWDFGDGTQSTEKNPQKTFSYTGNYTVSLRVTNDKGCWSVATKQSYIKIAGGLDANFSILLPTACQPPQLVSFKNLTAGAGALNYQWDFGDGGTSTDANPTHLYASEGLFNVMLIARTSTGCSDTVRQQTMVKLQPTTPSFAAPDSACVNQPVNFQNSSIGATAVLWNFGDNTTSVAANPVKTFTAPGTYKVKLIQSFGTCQDTAEKDIRVFPLPKAAFSTNKTGDCRAPFTAQFQNESTGAVSYMWDFGDSTTSNLASPSHTYVKLGSYTVTLIATNASGCSDTLRIPGQINVSNPVITFASLPAIGCIPYTHQLTANVVSPEPVVSYSWNFGNGGTSTAASPTVTYTDQGTYTVQLTVTTASGCSETFSLPEAVRVGVKPVANFSAMPREVCAYQGVTFTNLSTGATAWEWDFGDGNKSVEQNPVYQYSDTGTFSVKLIANNNGCLESMTIPRYITIKPPVARFEYQTTCDNKLFLAFTDRSLGATSWEWDFGDGTKSTEPSPSHTFPRFGTYPVKLTVRNDTCFHILTRLISISSGVPDFTISPPAVCKGSSIEFKADTTNAANIVSYSWNFGNGSQPATGRIASAIFQNAGLYDVRLTITDHNGCTDSLVKKQAVRINGPTAGIIASNNNGCKGLRANFTDASKHDGRSRITAWRWNLGDGTIVNQTTPTPLQHTYANAGAYDVSLKVTDAGGCTDSLLLPALVNASFIQAGFTSADTISCPGAAINFTNTSAAQSAYTSTWTFGNSQQSQQQNPTTKYDREGRYTVSLTIKDAGGCTDTYSRENYVAVNSPRASFTVNDSVSSCTPFQVNFINTSRNYVEHVWTLNGGTSILPNPTQYYNDPGTYETSLIVTSPGGCTDTARKKITVYDMSAAKLDYLPLNGCKPLLVNVKAATPVKMNLIWDFGDGNIINNNDLNRRHTYNFFGDFVPKVIMTDSSGCIITVTGLDTIRIQGATASFGLDRRLLCDSGLVRFTDSTTANTSIASYHWNFGDGNTSSETSPNYYFSRPGTYPVSLSVKTENQCVDTFRLQIPVRVVASPAIRIGGDTVICVGESLAHLGLLERSDTSAVQWTWQFPNGRTGAGQLPPPQTYNVPGKMLVQTTAVNSSGCKDTANQPIYINPLPTVQLPATITTLVGTPVLLPAVYSGPMRSYSWSLPDNLSCTTCPQPIASPRMDTKYTVAFVDNNGCRNVGQVQVIVLCKNENVFIPNTFSPNGDGSNDIFYVRGRGLSRVKTMRIFNRWGQVVFERLNFNVNDASVGWDGTFKGAKAIPDVYVYQVEIFCDNNQIVKYDGNVALIQ